MVRNLEELGPNLQKIIKRILANQDLLKLLYYTNKDPLSGQDLTSEQIENEVYEKLVKIVPRVGPKETANSLITMRVIRGHTNSENNEVQDITLHFEVFTPMTQWMIKDSNLRPFAIMGQLQKTLNGKIINGLGRLVGGDFQLNFLTDEISCYEIEYGIEEYN